MFERVRVHDHCYAGTVVAMEKEPGILKEEHKAVIEGLRDTVVVDLTGLL